MDLKGILSIGGHSGLYKHVTQTRTGIIVESLEDQKRMPAFATSKISALEDIAIYTDSGDIQLADVFKKIFDKENGGECLSHKSDDKKIAAYFAEILPDYDREKVYISHMKRVLNWYNLLHKHGLVIFEEEKTVEVTDEVQPETTEDVVTTTDSEIKE
jgi:hypothetical protein